MSGEAYGQAYAKEYTVALNIRVIAIDSEDASRQVLEGQFSEEDMQIVDVLSGEWGG